MNTPTRAPTSSATTLVIQWNALVNPADGGSPVTSYMVEWDAGTYGASWQVVIGYSPAYLGLNASVTGGSSGLIVGASYQFRVTASNVLGWGTPSSIVTVIAA